MFFIKNYFLQSLLSFFVLIKLFIRRFTKLLSTVCTVTVVLSLLAWQTVVLAQTQNAGALPPIISLLLSEDGLPDDDFQCPSVTPETTIIGSQTITSQAQLDELEGVTRIDGGISIDPPVTSLDFSPLDSLVELSGGFSLFPSDLTSIDGFNCLTDIGFNFLFFDNSNLESISGFNSLTSIAGDLTIFNSPSLTSISGFSALTSVGEDLSITDNEILINIPEFPALTSVRGDVQISSNSLLSSISGFNALTTGSLRIRLNPNLTSISGLNLLPSSRIRIDQNSNFDCSNPTPSFVPINRSFGNLVDCPVE